jgi:dienelactone hydrolase
VIPANGPKFAAHVAFYPACNLTYWGPPSSFTGAPLMLALGGSDDYTSTPLCVAYGEKLKTVLPRVDVQVYEGAYHDFDAVTGLHRWLPTAVNNIKCTGTEVDIETFTVKDLATGKVYKDGNAYPGGVFGCVGRGGTVSNSWSAARKSEQDVRSFLTDVLNLSRN